MRTTGSKNKNILHYKLIEYDDFTRQQERNVHFCYTTDDITMRIGASRSTIKKMAKGEDILKYLKYEIIRIRTPVYF